MKWFTSLGGTYLSRLYLSVRNVMCTTRRFLDEIKTLIGAETSRIGCIRVFNMFQHKTLNKRLAYVFLEGFLVTLFPDNKFQEVLRKIHSQSPRVSSDINAGKRRYSVIANIFA